MRKQLEDSTCRCIVLYNIKSWMRSQRYFSLLHKQQGGSLFIQSSGSHFFLEHQLGGLHLVLRLPQDGNHLMMGK